jgi:hypothetical protein
MVSVLELGEPVYQNIDPGAWDFADYHHKNQSYKIRWDYHNKNITPNHVHLGLYLYWVKLITYG